MLSYLVSVIAFAALSLGVVLPPDPPLAACSCPADLLTDHGVLIHTWPAFQCAYPAGACTWDETGTLLNKAQTNCIGKVLIPKTGFVCPLDKHLTHGKLINHLFKFQCAFPDGACTWDATGALTNKAQTNCPTALTPCVQN